MSEQKRTNSSPKSRGNWGYALVPEENWPFKREKKNKKVMKPKEKREEL